MRGTRQVIVKRHVERTTDGPIRSIQICVWFAKQGIETFYQKGYRICPGRQPVCINLKLFILLNVLLPPSRFSEAFFLLHLWLLLNVTGLPAKIAGSVSHSWKPYQTHHTSPLACIRDPFFNPLFALINVVLIVENQIHMINWSLKPPDMNITGYTKMCIRWLIVMVLIDSCCD